MDVAHPEIKRAMEAASAQAGFQCAPVMAAMQQKAIDNALRAALSSYDAPPCPAGQFQHTHTHKTLMDLVCHLEWDAGDPDTGLEDRVTLCAAYLRGVDIADRLTDREVDAIESEAHNASTVRKRDYIPTEAELIGAELDAESLEQGEPA